MSTSVDGPWRSFMHAVFPYTGKTRWSDRRVACFPSVDSGACGYNMLMKYVTTAAMLLALGATAPVLAQNASPTPNPAMRQEFRQVHQQMRQIHTQARSEILGALTSAHKSLLATV